VVTVAPDSIPKILLRHLQRYPAMQAQDVYKLLHQAALGSEHAFNSENAARLWLEKEWAEMGSGPTEPLLDPVNPDGSLVRLHLRPCKAAGKDPARILQVFIQTASHHQGSVQTLQDYLHLAVACVKAHPGGPKPETLQDYFAQMEQKGFPAVHHSEAYARLYRPAYRLVSTLFLEEL
jgi:hypothetical protein